MNSSDVAWELLPSQGNETWRSVGQINGFGGVCTTTLIVPPNCPPEKMAQASPIAITNGHCTPEGGKDYPDKAKIDFNYFKDQAGQHVSVEIDKKPLYTTMKKYDIAFVGIKGTYADLASKKIFPKKLASRPMQGDLTNIAIPNTGIEEGQSYLRRSQCTTGDAAQIAEGPYYWPHQNIANCSVSGGSSGSALFNNSGEIAGLINTGVFNTEHKPATCAGNNPCEVGGGQESTQLNNYGFSTHFLQKCFTDCKLDLRRADCQLPEDPYFISSGLGQATNNPKAPLNLSHPTFDSFKTKLCQMSDLSCNCEDSSGYTVAPKGVSLESLSTAPLKDGRYRLCAIGRKNGQWQPAEDATQMPIELDRVAPVFEAAYKTQAKQTAVYIDDRNLSYFLAPAQSAKGCNFLDKKAWRTGLIAYNNALNMYQMEKFNLTAQPIICVKAVDSAGNITIKAISSQVQ